MAGDEKIHMIGFFDCIRNSENDHMLGILLVTDNRSVAREFHVTHAVRPTEIQRRAHGGELYRHVAVDLCGPPLVKSLRASPRVIFVRDPVLLGLRRSVGFPMLCLDSMGGQTASPEHPEDAKVLPEESDSGGAADMLGVFDRLRRCHELLSAEKPEFRLT